MASATSAITSAIRPLETPYRADHSPLLKCGLRFR
jgi:hypothetical protein